MVKLLPLEIIEQILYFLPNKDKIQCLTTCKFWYTNLYRVLVKTVVIQNKSQLKQFLNVIIHHSQLTAPYVREIHLKNRVGITLEVFELLGEYCPYIEIFKFRDWRHYVFPALIHFKKIKQLPKMYDRYKAQNALLETYTTLTHLDLNQRVVRELVVQGHLLIFLSLGRNLTHLSLDGYYSPTTRLGQLELSHSQIDLIHRNCLQLSFIQFHTVTLTANQAEINKMKAMIANHQLQTVPKMKTLVLRCLELDHPIWLSYISRKYPNLTKLDIRFDLGAFVNYDETVARLNPSDCKIAFLDMANHLVKLKSLSLQCLKASYFPGKEFFDVLPAHQIKLEHLCIRYHTDILSPCGFNKQVLESIVHGQMKTIKSLDIDMWIHSHENMYAFLEPISACSRLVQLSLASDDIGRYNYNPIPIDTILDACPLLQSLELIRTAITIDDKHTANKFHPLKKMMIAISRISEHLFKYLTKRCPKITHLEVSTSFWMPRELEMTIDMHNNHFEFIRIGDLNKLNVPRLEGNLGNGTSVNLFSVIQLDRIKKKMERYQQKNCKEIPIEDDFTDYYHLYEVDDGRLRYPPSVTRKLHREEVISLKYLLQFYKENYQRDQMGINGYLVDRYLPKKYWRDDIQFGCIQIKCKSIRTLKYNFNIITWPAMA